MKKYFSEVISVLIALALFTLLASSNAFSAPNKVEQTDRLIQKWLTIEQQRNAMVNDWNQQKPLLEQRLSLLKQEQLQLEKSLKTTNATDNEVEEKRTQLLESQNTMESMQANLEKSLLRYYQIIAQLHPQLPPPLYNAWHKKLTSNELKNADITIKLNTLLELLEQLNDFEQRISHTQSPLVLSSEQGNKEVMVHQLYIGLSQAWYVSLDGSLVGRGVPDDSGWKWIADQSVEADTVLNAIAMIERRSEAKFLQLPISLTFNKTSTHSPVNSMSSY
jgi:chromosome segregation ATPase